MAWSRNSATAPTNAQAPMRKSKLNLNPTSPRYPISLQGGRKLVVDLKLRARPAMHKSQAKRKLRKGLWSSIPEEDSEQCIL